MDKALIFFVKYPQPGMVKTRLAKSIGEKEAALVYERLAQEIFREIRGLHEDVCDLWVAYDPPQKEQEIIRWLGTGYSLMPQQGDGLTQRLVNAFQNIFARGYRSVLVTGSDTLNFRKEIIMRAFEKLNGHDLVIGPAKDGGYYLIGSNTFYPRLFEGIHWSTSTVLQETLDHSRALGLRCALLEELEDLDDVQGLRKD